MTASYWVNLRRTMGHHLPGCSPRKIRSPADHVDPNNAMAFTASMVIAFPRPLVLAMGQSPAG